MVNLNHLGADVEVISHALGDQAGTGHLRINGWNSEDSFRVDGAEVGLTALEVDVTTLDALLQERPHLRFRRIILKIDVKVVNWLCFLGRDNCSPRAT